MNDNYHHHQLLLSSSSSSSSSSSHSPPVLISGNLNKLQSGLFKSWKVRYFELILSTNSTLVYYENEKKLKLLGAIEVNNSWLKYSNKKNLKNNYNEILNNNDSSLIRNNSNEFASDKTVFGLLNKDKNKMIWIQGKTEALTEKWINALIQAGAVDGNNTTADASNNNTKGSIITSINNNNHSTISSSAQSTSNSIINGNINNNTNHNNISSSSSTIHDDTFSTIDPSNLALSPAINRRMQKQYSFVSHNQTSLISNPSSSNSNTLINSSTFTPPIAISEDGEAVEVIISPTNAAILPVPQSELHCGLMNLSISTISEQNQYLFILNASGELCYHEHNNNEVGRRVGVISLNNCTLQRVASGVKNVHFSILSNGKKYLFSCNSAEDSNKWIQLIQTQIHKYSQMTDNIELIDNNNNDVKMSEGDNNNSNIVEDLPRITDPVINTPVEENMNGVIDLMQSFSSLQFGVHALTIRLTSALSHNNNSSYSFTREERAELQSQIAELGLLLRRVSSTYSGLGRLLAQISTNTTNPSDRLVLLDHPIGQGAQPIISPIPQGSLAMSIQTAVPTIIHGDNNNDAIMQLLSRFAGNNRSSSGNNNNNNNNGNNTSNPNQPQQQSQAQPSTNNSTSNNTNSNSGNSNNTSNPLASIMNMFGPMINGIGGSNNQQQSNQQAGMNGLAGIMNMMGPILSGVNNNNQNNSNNLNNAQPASNNTTNSNVVNAVINSSISSSSSSSSSSQTSHPSPPLHSVQAAPIAQPVSSSSAIQSNPLAAMLSGLSRDSGSNNNTTNNNAVGGNMLMSMLNGLLSSPNSSNPNSSIMDVFSNVIGNNNNNSSSRSNNENDEGNSMDDNVDDDDSSSIPSMFDLFLTRIIRSVSMPDLLMMVQGNFSGLDKAEEGLYELIMSLIDDEDNDENRQEIANQLADSILQSTLSDSVIQPFNAQLKPNKNIQSISLPIVKKEFRKLIDFIIDRNKNKKNNHQTAFSVILKQWVSNLMGSWLDSLVDCYSDGLITVEKLVRAAVANKASIIAGSELAFFAPMFSGTFTTMIINNYHTYKQQQLVQSNNNSSSSSFGSENWLELVPANERNIWENIIKNDQQKLIQQLNERNKEKELLINNNNNNQSSGLVQEYKVSEINSNFTGSLYRPLSNSYRTGAAGGQKRKQMQTESKNNNNNVITEDDENKSNNNNNNRLQLGSNFLYSTLRQAIESVEGKPELKENSIIDSVVSSLQSQLEFSYSNQVAMDLSTLVNSNSDYLHNPNRFPNIQNKIQKKQ